MTPRQARAARAMLGLGMKEVCALAGVGKRTLTEFESGYRAISGATANKIKAFYISKGLHFSIADVGEGVGFAPIESIAVSSSEVRPKKEYVDLLAVGETVDSIASIVEIQKKIVTKLTISQLIIFAVLDRTGAQKKDLAEQLNCTPSFISAIAVGKKTIPLSSAEVLQSFFDLRDLNVASALRQEKLIAKLSYQLLSVAEESRKAWLEIIL